MNYQREQTTCICRKQQTNPLRTITDLSCVEAHSPMRFDRTDLEDKLQIHNFNVRWFFKITGGNYNPSGSRKFRNGNALMGRNACQNG